MAIFRSCSACSTTYTGDRCPRCYEADEPASPPLFQPGQLFHGLEIVNLLSSSEMGQVYKARQLTIDRFVALKILPPDRVRFFEFESRFEREARALAALSHPHIVTLYDYGIEKEICFLTTEFVEGSTLRQALKPGPMERSKVVEIVRQLCDALAYAHDEGVVHRDIKPENILLDRKSRVKLTDFGMIKWNRTGQEVTPLTESLALLGTVAYMAPEQLERAKDVDARADIFSLGIVFHEMLTGEFPTAGCAVSSWILQHHPDLGAVIRKAIAKAPDQRYNSVAHLRSEIR